MADLPATLTPSVAVSWDGSGLFTGAYDDVTADVLADPGLSIDLGKDGARTLDPPKVASCDFSLVNHTGKYSQERGDSPVYQLVLPSRPVRVLGSHGESDVYTAPTPYTETDYYDGTTTYTLARTTIDDISQQTGYGQQTVGLATIGIERVLVAARVSVPIMTSPRVDQCITALLDAVGWPSDKRAISIADTTLAYWWADDRDPWSAMLELLQSEGPGALYVDGDSVLHFENRNYRATAPRSTHTQAIYYDTGRVDADAFTSDTLYTEDDTYDGGTSGLYFTALSYEPGFKNIYNRAAYTIRDVALGALAVVWTGPASLSLSPGQTMSLVAKPNDPFMNAVTPSLAGGDFTIGGGGSVAISLSQTSGLATSIQISATSGSPTVNGLRLRAQPLTGLGETTVSNDVDASESIDRFSPIPGADIPVVLDVQGWPIISAGFAVAVCNAWVNRYMIQRPTVTIELRNGDGALLAEILRRQISDRITLLERNTGLAADVWVNSKQLTISGPCGCDVRAVLRCEKVEEVFGVLWDAPTSLWDDFSTRWGV